MTVVTSELHAPLSGSLLSGVQSPNKLGTPVAAPMIREAPR